MKILLTGAAGFIGSHTCERLVGLGHQVIGVDAFDGYLYPAAPKRANAAELARLDRERFRLVEADICDVDAMNALLDEGVDVVCHLAALAGVRPSIVEPLRYIRANLHGTTVILEGMRARNLQRLVFASSSSVYGVRAEPGQELAEVTAFREDDPCLHPASPYAATKRAGEMLCSTYRDLYGIGSSSLRFFTVYGPRQRPDMAIHKFVAAIAAGKPITLFGDGSTRRDYTFIDDIVSGTVAAIDRVRPGALDLYNLGGTHTTSLAELVATCERVVGKPAIIERLPLQPGDVPVTYADIARAHRDLGYQPTTQVADGIARFWEWYRGRHATG